MASLKTLELRIAASEARLADVEGHGAGLRRMLVELDLNLAKVLAHQQIDGATEEEIDAAMAAE